MKYYSSTNHQDRHHVLQFDPDDLLLEGILDFLDTAGVRNGVVVSGIGTLADTTMHMVTTTNFPPVEVKPTWNDRALELVSMQGVVADGVPHIHMMVSDDTTAVGGHLEPACRVLYLAEVVIREFSDLELTRVPNDQDILKLVPAE